MSGKHLRRVAFNKSQGWAQPTSTQIEDIVRFEISGNEGLMDLPGRTIFSPIGGLHNHV